MPSEAEIFEKTGEIFYAKRPRADAACVLTENAEDSFEIHGKSRTIESKIQSGHYALYSQGKGVVSKR